MKIFYLIAWFAAIAISPARAQTNTNAIAEVLSPAKTNAPAATNAPAIAKNPARGLTTISSDSWVVHMDKREATYRGNVRVDDPRMKLTCAWLVADLPESGARINHILAETNVVIDFTNEKGQVTHATSDKAIYDYNVTNGVTNETVTLTGHAKAENAQFTLTGEPIVWDRANDSLTATNEQMTIRQNPNGIPAKTNAPAAGTNNFSAPK
ncbi:MAG: LptA/OstA family protein [Limisphaerales bacterium]